MKDVIGTMYTQYQQGMQGRGGAASRDQKHCGDPLILPPSLRLQLVRAPNFLDN